jgi:hypothetical protein
MALFTLILLAALSLACILLVSLFLIGRVPLSYNFRNVFVRWRATLATVLGVALVVVILTKPRPAAALST